MAASCCWPRGERSSSSVAGEPRVVAADDAARYRDALGCALPLGLPAAFTDPVPRPLEDLVGRYARTHGPFTEREVAGRLGVPGGAHRRSPGGAGDRRARRARRVPTRGRAARVVRRRRAAPAAAALAGVAAAGGRAGRAGGARPVPAGVARHPARAARRRGRRRGARACSPGAPLVGLDARDRRAAGAGARLPAGRSSTSCARRATCVWVGAGAIGSSDGRVRLYFADQLPLLAPGWERTEPAGRPAARRAARGARRAGRQLLGPAPGRRRRTPPTTSCSPRCGTWCGPARSPTTRWRRCAPSPPAAAVARAAPKAGAREVGRGRAGCSGSAHRPAPGAGASSRRCSSRCRRRPSRRTPPPSSSSSATASSPARPCSPRASSAGTPRCTAC